MQLDILDKKILYELETNARQPLSRIARKVKRSRSVVEYRMRKMEGAGVIQNYVTLLDAGRMGLMIWNVYLEFHNMTHEMEASVIKYLNENKRVWWVAKTAGTWDMVYSIFVKDVKEFYETVEAFNSKFGDIILRQSLAAHVEVEILTRGYLVGKESEGVTWYDMFENRELDHNDLQILKLLSTNARIPSIEIAQEVGISSNAVIERIKRLQSEGIITRFRLQLNVEELDRSFYKILITVKNQSETQNHTLLEHCKQLGCVFHYEKKIGPWMLELEMDVESYEEVNKIMKEMKEKYPRYISSYDILLVTDEPKGELDLTQQF